MNVVLVVILWQTNFGEHCDRPDSIFCSLPKNKLSLIGCTLCSSGCCTKVPFYLLYKTYICLSRQVIQWPPYGWCRGQSVIIYYNKRHGVRWCTVYLSICQRLQYFIIRRVFVCPDIWQALPLLRMVVLLVIYSRRWRILGAGLDPRLGSDSFFVCSFLRNNPFIWMRNHLVILLQAE